MPESLEQQTRGSQKEPLNVLPVPRAGLSTEPLWPSAPLPDAPPPLARAPLLSQGRSCLPSLPASPGSRVLSLQLPSLRLSISFRKISEDKQKKKFLVSGIGVRVRKDMTGLLPPRNQGRPGHQHVLQQAAPAGAPGMAGAGMSAPGLAADSSWRTPGWVPQPLVTLSPPSAAVDDPPSPGPGGLENPCNFTQASAASQPWPDPPRARWSRDSAGLALISVGNPSRKQLRTCGALHAPAARPPRSGF